MAAQLVAGASSHILSLAAGFSGDRADLEVLRLSSLNRELEQGRLLDPRQYPVAVPGRGPLLLWLTAHGATPGAGGTRLPGDNVLLAREDYSALAPEEGEEAEINLGAMQSQRVEEFKLDKRAVALRSALAATISESRTPAKHR